MRRSRWTPIVGWTLAVATVAVGVIMIYRPDPEPAEVVRAYLDAVRAGDMSTAMTYVEGSDQLDGDATLLDSTGGDWQVLGVTQHVDDDSDIARVKVRLGVDGREVRPPEGEPDWFTLSREPDGGWRIDKPLASLSVQTGPLPHLVLSGATAQTRAGAEYLVFPGVYDVYPDPDGLVEVTPERLALEPDSSGWAPKEVKLTEHGKETADAAVRELLDICTLGYDIAPGCAFDLPETMWLADRTLEHIRDVRWQFSSYPEVDVEPNGGSFRMNTAQWSASVTGISGPQDAPQPFTLTCATSGGPFEVVLGEDDQLRAFQDQDRTLLHTCE